jgi:hypothetical protein
MTVGVGVSVGVGVNVGVAVGVSLGGMGVFVALSRRVRDGGSVSSPMSCVQAEINNKTTIMMIILRVGMCIELLIVNAIINPLFSLGFVRA